MIMPNEMCDMIIDLIVELPDLKIESEKDLIKALGLYVVARSNSKNINSVWERFKAFHNIKE